MQARDVAVGRWWRFVIVGVLAWQISWGLRISRIDHPDELWTLAAIKGSFGQLIAYILGNDNHPPLYYVVIKAWSLMAGESIGSIRLLSYLFGLLTLLLFALFHRRSRPISFVAPLLVLATNPLFTYYSATVRPYALLVCLGAGAILSSIALRSEPSHQSHQSGRLGLQVLFYGSCLLLGFTHYYGLLYAMILLALDFLERRISFSRLPTIIVAALLVAWPLLQIFFGSLDKQFESNAWVNVVPFISTFNNLLMGLFPSVTLSRTPPHLFAFGLLLSLVSILVAPRLKPSSFGWARILSFMRSDVGYLLSGLVLVFAASLVADLSVPFSTPYYFLVCLPAVALLVGYWVRWMRWRLGLLPASFFLASVALTQVMLTRQRFMVP
jgi:uncharacterized membrane protein